MQSLIAGEIRLGFAIDLHDLDRVMIVIFKCRKQGTVFTNWPSPVINSFRFHRCQLGF